PARAIPPPLCQEIADLLKDRPDLLPEAQWNIGAFCLGSPALRIVGEKEWLENKVVAQTGLIGRGPWRGIPATKEALESAWQHAPWSSAVAELLLRTEYGLTPPPSELRRAYGRLLDYNLPAMAQVASAMHDDDDEVQRIAERICENDIEVCGS